MAWRVVAVEAQRLRFVEAAHAGERSFSSLCEEYGISRPTGYLWVKRYREQGAAGMREGSHTPLRIPHRSSDELEERIVSLRRKHPDWGARKLRVLLRRSGVEVPSSTVHRVLRRHGLIHPLDSHPSATGSFCREAPNQLWQMDFKSPKGWNAHLGPLSVLDDHSRYAVVLEQLPSGQGKVVQARLERAFCDCGLPDAMHFSGIAHPQTQGKVERFHGSLERARRRHGLVDITPGQSWLDDFRKEYNHVRPHQALGMDTPAEHWQPSQQSYAGPRDPVYAPDAEVHQLNGSGSLRVNGRKWQVAGALAYQNVRLARIHERILVFYGDTPIREINPTEEGSTIVNPSPANYLNL